MAMLLGGSGYIHSGLSLRKTLAVNNKKVSLEALNKAIYYLK